MFPLNFLNPSGGVLLCIKVYSTTVFGIDVVKLKEVCGFSCVSPCYPSPFCRILCWFIWYIVILHTHRICGGVLILHIDNTTIFWCMSRESLFITDGVLTSEYPIWILYKVQKVYFVKFCVEICRPHVQMQHIHIVCQVSGLLGWWGLVVACKTSI